MVVQVGRIGAVVCLLKGLRPRRHTTQVEGALRLKRPTHVRATRDNGQVADTLFSVPSHDVAVSPDDCYTPTWVFTAMGLKFDLDVAAPVGGAPNVPAKRHYHAADDGRVQPWSGLVWCNPPFSNFTPWADRWAKHPTGVLLGCYQPGTKWTPTVLMAAEYVSFITPLFTRPGREPIRPRMGVFVAFRGVGQEPAIRLAAADPTGGSVLRGIAA